MKNELINYSDILDIMNEGLIFIDEEGIIKQYSEKAKDVFGINRFCKYPHKSGKINNGDIILMATTTLGVDDGGLTPEDLNLMGIDSSDISQGDAVLCYGKFGDEKSRGVYNVKHSRAILDESELEGNIDGVKIKIILNFSNRFSSIDVDDVTYKTNYNNDFGHLVVLDEKTHEMKFYQTFGYTAWNEDIKELFMGEKFKEKIEGKNTMDVIGTHIFEYHQKSDIILDLVEGKRTYSGKLARINGVSVLCGVKPIIRDNKKAGSLLIVENISKMKNIKNQRDYAFKELESAKAELDDKKTYNKLFPRIIGSSDNAMKTKKLAYRASKSNSTVLILGESGTGKTILAKSIHEASERKCNPLIQVNCNSIPESLLESELFGYEKGAFTGASVKGKKGYFEMADKGTIFLDEIGDISKNMQVKLLHVIQSKSFYKVGGNDEINVDVRIIVATNRNLEKEVQKRNFREDLFYRINVFPIKIPSLEERIEDIDELVVFLLPNICERVGTELKRVSEEAMVKLMRYPWPGNIRELENVLERAVNLCEESNILSNHIEITEKKLKVRANKDFIRPIRDILEETEKEAIASVLKYTKGDKKTAMEILDMKKSKFYNMLKKI